MRMVLRAQIRDVLRLVVVERVRGMRPILPGIVSGLGAALASAPPWPASSLDL